VTYSFPAGLKTFDPSKAFSGGYGDFSSASSLKSGGGMDPASIALAAGSGLASIFTGIGQQRTSASIAQAQLAAQNAAMLEGREQNKGQLAGSLFNKLFDVGSGGDIAFGREKAGKEFLVGPYAERVRGLEREAAKDARMAAISPESKERAQFENRLAIDREIAARRAQTDAMFGPISSSYIA
jgi:hypothetical protein